MHPRLFPPRDGPIVKTRAIARLTERHPAAFPSIDAAQRYLTHWWFPASRRWRYQLNGKSGNTYALALLFRLEFGVPFTARVVTEANQHPDFALFQQVDAGLLSNAARAGDRLPDVIRFPGLTLATVRNPYARAFSAYRYLCRSHRVGDRRFLRERIRLNALQGFDWETDPDRPAGFVKFLRYVAEIKETCPTAEIDAHWLPQVLHIQPTVLRPDVIGRTEDMARFAAEVVDRLAPGTAVPLDSLPRNEGAGDLSAAYAEAEAARLVADIYAEDFDRFGYPTALPTR